MKRIGNIYSKLCDKNNIKIAIIKASAGKNKKKNKKINLMKNIKK